MQIGGMHLHPPHPPLWIRHWLKPGVRINGTYYRDVFLPRDALVHSAVLRLHVVRTSVCPSLCPSVRTSVTLVDQDHIGWKSWKLYIYNCTDA